MKILCIQLKQLGDVLTTTPAVRALARRYPGCEIDFITQRPADTVYAHSPHVREVITVRWRAAELFPVLRRIYARRYDLLVDFSGSSKTAIFAFATRIPRRLGLASGKSWCFTDAVEVPAEITYAAARRLEILRPLGIDDDDPALEFFTGDAETALFDARAAELGIAPGPLVAVSPVSKRAYKVWPAERFAILCDRLVEQYGAQIFFLIGPGESRYAEAVQNHMRQQALPVVDSLNLYEAACLLDRAVCYLGNDNGLMHLSIARGRPTIGVFGRPKARNWASPLPLQTALEFDPGCKDKCYYPGCELECLTGISVDSVWSELQAVFDASD